MATNDLGVTVPAGTDVFDPQGDMVDLANSLRSRVIIPVANTTARAALVAAIDWTPSAAEPLRVSRADAVAGYRDEITYDGGTTWLTAGSTVGWTTFSPSWAGVSAGTGGVNTGQVLVQNGLASVLTSLNFGTGGTVGGVATLTLPVATSAPAGSNLGTAFLYDGSTTTTHVGLVVSTSSTAATVRGHAMVGTVTTGVPWAWTVNDAIRLNLSYPV